uniref:(northern house mosquito) hypothetical protein n=1 Tax=Culex pipiens TaxID=7175 RepID=A0A8D8NNP1_CULPI
MCLYMSGQIYKKRPTKKKRALTSCASTTCNAQMGTHGRPRGGSNNPPSIKSLIPLIVCVWGFLLCRIDNGGPNFWICPAHPLWNGIPFHFPRGKLHAKLELVKLLLFYLKNYKKSRFLSIVFNLKSKFM